MTATRAMRIGLLLFGLFIVVLVLLFLGGSISPRILTDGLLGMRHFLVMMGVPVGAVLLSEMPLRDGITHRTLLYPLLGPTPRFTLAIVRVALTGAILALGAALLLLLIRVLLRDGFAFLPRELLSVTLGAFAYTALFGLIHLYSRRGLITGLVLLFLFDVPLGTIPFSLRNASLSYHMGVIANQQDNLKLPISFGLPETSVVASALVLVAVAAVFLVAVAAGFKRKDLGELC